jgi:lambda family phage portal protein
MARSFKNFFGLFGKKTQKRQYAGAQYNRLVAEWVSQGTSADAEIRSSLPKLRARSRQLARDNDYVRGAFRTIRNNVIGQGIPFQAQVRMQRGNKLDEKMNSSIEAAWASWCKAERCHVSGKLSFADIERLIMTAVPKNGEIIIRKVRAPFGGSRVPLALEIIESDVLDDTYNGQAQNGNEIRMGVEIDQWRRPVAYYFFDRHPGDYSYGSGASAHAGHRRRVEATEIIHLYPTEDENQTRGVPWIASSIMRLHQMHGYEEAEIIAARATASLMGFIESPEGEMQADGEQDGQKVTEFEPGVFKQLAPGEKVSIPQLSRPGGQFDPFMKVMLRGVGAGIGLSYESVSKDYSNSTYSSARQALLEDRDNYRAIQAWLIENFHQKVFEEWLDMAYLAGVVDLPKYATNPELYQGVRWMPRGWTWIDPLKEVEAYKSAVRAGFKTVSDVIAESGGDFEENMVTKSREAQVCKTYGVVLDTDPSLVDGKGSLVQQIIAPEEISPAKENNGKPPEA